MKKQLLGWYALLVIGALAPAQQKHALVIGNGAYRHITPLTNPANDARDMEAALKTLGFTVEAVIDGSLEQMESAAIGLKNRLSASRNSYGFLFYAGHGVQSNGENYLLPAEANIQSESFLRARAVSVQSLLDELNAAGNELNIVVLDACRDNPFGWSRSGTRGLSLVANQPADSIIVYATAAQSTAADGTGRNGLFTGHLLKNLKTSGLSVNEVFFKTMGDVARASGNKQRPAVYSHYAGTAYLGSKPQAGAVTPPAPTPAPPPVTSQAHTGTITVTSEIAGMVLIDGRETGARIKAQGSATIANVSAGATEVAVREDSGGVTRAAQNVVVRQGQTVAAAIERPRPADFVKIPGGTFTMGSPANEAERYDDEIQHQVTVGTFYLGKYEVTVGEFRQFVNDAGYKTTAETGGGEYVFTGGGWEEKADASWRNPYFSQTDRQPVVLVSWHDAAEYCNWRSRKEGLTPAYRINGTDVSWDRSANGYRLPTEAEWEYACRAGTSGPFSTGNNITPEQANYNGNYPYNSSAKGTFREKTVTVGSFAANRWGLYDMHGNVWEWCWDWYGDYSSGAQTDPAGPSTGAYRVVRGGSWYYFGRYLRSADRDYSAPADRYYFVGFRLARP